MSSTATLLLARWKILLARHPGVLALLAYFLAAICWGHSGVVARISMKSYTAYTAMSLRLTMATAGALFLQWRWAKEVKTSGAQRLWLTLSGLLGGMGYACVYSANQFVTSSVTTSVLATESGIATFIAFAQRRKGTTITNVAGGLVGFLGVCAIYSERAVLSPNQGWAILILVLGALFFAVAAFPMETAKDVHPYARLAPLLAPMALVAWLATFIDAAVKGNPISMRWELAPSLAIVHVGLIGTLLPFIAFYAVVERWGAARAVTMTFIIPPIAFLADQIGETEPMHLGTAGLFGAGLVLLGVLLSFKREKR